MNALITQDAATETTLATVIDGVNALILQLSQTVEKREAKKKETTEETDQ